MITRKYRTALPSLVGALMLLGLPAAWGQAPQRDVKPHSGMMRYPDISATHIVFTYANDLWLVPREGGVALPLASPPGAETFPRFSADGRTIAFVGNYDGNRDLYTIPVEGGLPHRVTYHPSTEFLCDWTAEGKLLFATNGLAGLGRQRQLFLVPARGGLPAKLPVPYGEDASLSADGQWLAYTPHTTLFSTWKRYQGGMATDIWLFDLKSLRSKKITDWAGTDGVPMWHGEKLYYLSDQGAEHRLNIWVYDVKTGRRQQVTRFREYDVKWPSIGPGPKGGGEIVYQYGSELQTLDLSTGKTRTVEVRIPGDRPTLRARAVDASRFIENWSLSATGKRVAVEARGDIWTLPAKDGTPRNLTRTSGVAERDPAWSPDGRWIAYFSDKTGEYELYITQSDGRGETKALTKDGKAFRWMPRWSPDSRHILFGDKTGSLFLYTLASGQTKLVDRDNWDIRLSASWSPDSRWLVYARNDDRSQQGVLWFYNVETGEKRSVTSGMFNDVQPVFDRKGEYLYFISNRNFRPTYEDFGTTWIYTGSEMLMAVPLRKDVKYPYMPKVDEETWSEPKTEDKPRTGQISLERAAPQIAAQADEVSGVWEGRATGQELPGGSISFKITLKLGAGNMVSGTLETQMGNGTVSGTYQPASKELNLSGSLDGGIALSMTAKINGAVMSGTASAGGGGFPFRAQRIGGAAVPGATGQGGAPQAQGGAPKTPERVTIDFDGFEARAIALPVRPGRFSGLSVNDRHQLIFVRIPVAGAEEGAGIKLFDINDEKREEKMVAAGASSYDLSADGKKLLVIRGNAATIQDAAPGAQGEAVVTSGMTAMIDPREEWRQLFNDAWRIERDFFYDPNMHGVDWVKVREQYAPMLADCVSREDVSYVIGEMIAELNVGHAYYFGGDVESQPSVSVGMMGVDFALENGAYRITNIYQGAAWDTDARNPLTQIGGQVKVGDYLLAVNGVPMDTDRDPWAAFQGLADRTVTLTVSDKPQRDSTAREVAVRLTGSDSNLRYRAWVERNRAYVEQQSNGRIGYIYVPDTGTGGQSDLLRQLVGQRGKEALIIDERWNGGGQIPTRFIELLNRPVTNYWARRDGNDFRWPPDSHQGPKAMLINGLAGSGGDAFPWYFRQAGLGKLIGTRTWGGLVGISGNPGLIDGGRVTAPTFAFYRKDGTWGIEGYGVDPDIEVVDDPALMVNGGDPQLDAAIKHLQEELKRNPYVAPKRPAYPNRSGAGVDRRDR